MKFRNKITNEVIGLKEIKQEYIKNKKEGNAKYINFGEYLMDCVNKYKTIEVV